MTEPFLRVVRGKPTAAELAALVTVLVARSAAPPVPPPVPSRWRDPADRLGRPRRGPYAWRRSGLPN